MFFQRMSFDIQYQTQLLQKLRIKPTIAATFHAKTETPVFDYIIQLNI